MFKKSLLFSLTLLILIFSAGLVHATQCTSFSGNGINNWYPFSYRTAEGKLTGIMPDVMKEALRRVGLELNLQEDKPWKRIMYDLKKSQVDMVLGAYWTKARAQEFIYSEQMGTDELRVFVKAGNEFPFNTFEDLIGRSGMHLLGGSLGDSFDRFAREHLDFREVPKSDIIISMIHKERADYGILGYIEGLKFINSLGLEGKIVPLSKPVLSNAMYALINKDAPCASQIQTINAKIIDMKKDGSLAKITAYHLSLIDQYSK